MKYANPAKPPRLSLLHAACLALPLLASPALYAAQAAPEAASGFTEKAPLQSHRFMIATANPLATAAGHRILQQGGSAIDAAIAAQLVLGLTEPQSSGIGGGAFLVHFDGKGVTAFDGREKAPAAAKPDRFLTGQGKEMEFDDAIVGGRSVGVPGVLGMLEQTHQRYGKLPWARLFEPAIRLAERGFSVSPRLNSLLGDEKFLALSEPARSYFYQADGSPKAVGTRLQNPDYAATLKLIARQGAKAFYQGPVAADIVQAVARHPSNPGDLTLQDLQQYRAQERQPVCGNYRVYQICGMAPPSSGGIAVLQMLKVMERFPLSDYAPLSPEAAHVFSEAGRLAFADRAKYLADSDYVAVPTAKLLDTRYLSQRSQLIDPLKAMGKAQAGTPEGVTVAMGLDNAVELPSTSHIVVVDRAGRAVSMTSSIEDQFGSRIMVRGFLLNNQLTDFSFSPEDNGKPVANRVEAGKRPRSSMSPVLVFDRNGKLQALTGSPGGSSIINYVAQTLVGLLDWKLNPQQAVSLPHYGSRNGPTELEKGRGLEALGEALKARGHTVKFTPMTSGLSAIIRTPHGWMGGADPRREGMAMGD